MRPQLALLVLLVLHPLLPAVLAFTPKFRDVTEKAGIDITAGKGSRRLLKYGGPTIADLDRDGHYDLIFSHHGSAPPEVYFNNGDASFSKAPFSTHRRDVHAITPFLLPSKRAFFFTVVPGGRAGNFPNPPIVYRTFRNRTIVDVTHRTGLDVYTARGRTVVFMPLRRRASYPDALYMNANSSPEKCPGCTDGQYDAYRYAGAKPYYKPLVLRGFNPNGSNDYGMAVDPDGDGQLELLTWRSLTIHKITGFFKSKDVSRAVLGDFAYADGVAAVVEIDYDNDGDFDLYVARDKSGNRSSAKGATFPDLLLENRDGVFVDVSEEAGIPRNTISRGVTAGDFDNDGWMDLYVSVLRGRDVLLLNNGDGTFESVDIGIGKQGAAGDNALAVDYDNDGRVDLIRSEGSWGNIQLGGQFRILRNVERRQDSSGRWVKVRVGRLGKQTSQHAVVVVSSPSHGLRLMQRVGQVGVQTPHSYFDKLHFGIGTARNVVVTVTWLSGATRNEEVAAGETAKFGRFYSTFRRSDTVRGHAS